MSMRTGAPRVIGAPVGGRGGTPGSAVGRSGPPPDRGVQYRAIRYTQRLAEAGAVASVGSKGDSYDNAMAEAFNSLYKAELVRNRGPWRGLEPATVEYIDWYNNRRLHGELGHVPPTEHETLHATTRSVTTTQKTR